MTMGNAVRERGGLAGRLVRIGMAGVLLATVLGVLPGGSARADVLVGVAANLSGADSFAGDQIVAGATQAIAEIEGGALLGEPVVLVPVDDGCNSDQAVAVAELLVERGVRLVVGHSCSGPSIAAAPIYGEAGVVMISASATNTRVTDEGGPHVFRVIGRDDRQGTVAARFIAREHADRRIAVVADDTAYGQGLAARTAEELVRLGHPPALRAEVERHGDMTALVDRLIGEEIDTVYLGGDAPDAGLIVRLAADKGRRLDLVSGDTLGAEEFWIVSGPAGEGAHFTFAPDPRETAEARAVVEAFRAGGREPLGYTLHAHAAVSVWAEAVSRAGTFDAAVVSKTLSGGAFDTVLGPLRFNEKGDVEGPETFVLYEWSNGSYRQITGSGATGTER